MIKYFCDFCKKNIVKQGLHVLTLQIPAREVKEQKHLCPECRKKLDKFLNTESNFIEVPKEPEKSETISLNVRSGKTDITSAQIEALTEEPKVTITLDSYTKVQQVKTILEKKPDWTMSHEICENFMKDEKAYLEYIQNKCSGQDAGKIVALINAGWKAKDIIGEIDLNKEDVISEIIFYYELTGNTPKLKSVGQIYAEKILKEEEPEVGPEKPVKEESRNISTEYIDEYLKPMRESRGVTSEMRKAILISYCTTTKSTNVVARECGVSQPCVLTLTKGYMDYLKSFESKDDIVIKSEEPEEEPLVDNVDTSKVAEFVSTLRKHSKVPNTLRVEIIRDACSGMSVSDVSRKHKVQAQLVTSLFKKYLEYLKEMS